MDMNYGFVYVLRNDAMPGIYKIGFTERSPRARCAELSGSTSIPIEFNVIAYGETEEPERVERQFHARYGRFRVSNNREFFRLSFDVVATLCEELKEQSFSFCVCDGFDFLQKDIYDSRNEPKGYRSLARIHYAIQSHDSLDESIDDNDWWAEQSTLTANSFNHRAD